MKPYERQINELKQLITTSPHSGFRITLDQRNPLETSLEDRQKYRRVSQVIFFDLLIQLHSESKKYDLSHSRAILGAARAMKDDCLLICQLVKLATYEFAIKSLEKTLGQVEQPFQLEILRREIGLELNTKTMSIATRGERLVLDILFENLDQCKLSLDQLATPNATSDSPFGYSKLIWSNYRRYMPDQRAEQLKIYNDFYQFSQLDFPEQTRQFNLYDDVFKSMTTYNRILIRLITPAFNKISAADQRNQASLRCAYVATACEQYRQKHNAWPKSLEEIPKSMLEFIPKDPYSGEPLKMNRTETGLVIYSVGKDEIDNNGETLDPKMEPGTDIGFRLYDVKHRHRPAKPKVVEPDSIVP